MKQKKKPLKKFREVKQSRIRKQKEDECFICGSTSNLQDHHIIPKSMGGDKLENNKVPLCSKCHRQLHILLDPVIVYLGQAIVDLQQELKKEKNGGTKIPIGFQFYKKGGKKNESKS